MNAWDVRTGDCVQVMAGMDAESVDAVVTDPPYGLEFMGKEWDRLGATIEYPADGEGPWGRTNGVRYGASALAMQIWHERWAREAYRVLKPGGHLLAFGGTRTYHRLACGIEDAGFEIRDKIEYDGFVIADAPLSWRYGSGFPKSLDVSKALDAMAGAEREVTGERRFTATNSPLFRDDNWSPDLEALRQDTAPATDLAREWSGWGTAFKPAHEPIVVARKPPRGNVAQNVAAFGTGGINVDACRIAGDVPQVTQGVGEASSWNPREEPREEPRESEPSPLGRWPANVVLGCACEPKVVGTRKAGNGHWPAQRGFGGLGTNGHAGQVALPERHDTESPVFAHDPWCAVAQLDAQSGELGFSSGVQQDSANSVYGGGIGLSRPGTQGTPIGYRDQGGASRFFYVAKASRAERERGLEAFGLQDAQVTKWSGDGMPLRQNGSERRMPRRANVHPTVKPVSLMQWLCRAVTPPGGLVLDPFIGSGSTGIAALREGFRVIGIEQDPDYAETARHRMVGDAPLFNQPAEWGVR